MLGMLSDSLSPDWAQECLYIIIGGPNRERRWPCDDWAVHFKLHAPGRTTVEGHYDGNGTLSRFTVTPSSRLADVQFHACVQRVVEDPHR